MKKKKLNLDQIKVESFVTSMDNEKENTVKGGAPMTDEPVCLDTVNIRWCDW